MASQKSRMISLITKEFGLEYSAAKSSDKKMKQLQREFFDAATEMLSQQSLARKTVEVPEGANAEWLEQHYPGWKVVSSIRPGEEPDTWEAVLEEDPAKLAFTYVNPDDHMVYARTTAQGTPMLDDERLRDEDPELWEQISDYPEPWLGLVQAAIKDALEEVEVAGLAKVGRVDLLYKLNPGVLAANFLRDQGVERALKPIDELTDEQLQAIQDYLVPAPVTVRLVPPRKAKQEELEEAGLV